MSSKSTSVFLLVLLVLFALAIRTWDLAVVPRGLHGDEALTALDAMWILEEGWIGPYVYPSGLGQPTGPLYFVALVFSFLEPSVFSVRFAMALVGVAAVVFTYLAARRMVSWPVALLAAFLLATMRWHLHLSRTGLMVGAWPCVFAATLWVLFIARDRGGVGWYTLAGALCGLGVYSYNAYVLTLPVLAAVFVADAFSGEGSAARSDWLRNAAVFGLTAMVIATPLVVYAAEHPGSYFYHHQTASLWGAEGWQTADWGGRAGQLVDRAGDWVSGLFLGGHPDFDDGTSGEGHPPIDPLVGLLAACGLLMALRTTPPATAAVLIASVLIFPLGGILTTGDGIYRRSFAIAPILCVAAAIPLEWLWRRRAKLAPAAVGAILTASACFNVLGYFVLDQRSSAVWQAFAVEFRKAAEVMAELPAGSRVYFYSGRWSVDYPPRKFLAPQVEAYDRSLEFGSGNPSIELPAVFFFLDSYRDRIDAVAETFPDGERNVVKHLGRDLFYLYHAD